MTSRTAAISADLISKIDQGSRYVEDENISRLRRSVQLSLQDMIVKQPVPEFTIEEAGSDPNAGFWSAPGGIGVDFPGGLTGIDIPGERLQRRGGAEGTIVVPGVTPKDLIVGDIVRANRFNVTPVQLETWLSTDPDKIKDNAALIRIDQAILRQVAITTPQFTERAINASDAAPARSDERLLRICRIVVKHPNSTPTTGTGCFVTENHVLTCWHTFGAVQSGAVAEIDLPHFAGELAGVSISCGRRFTVQSIQNVPFFLAHSPNMKDSAESSPWPPADLPPGPRLDYCIVEIDENTERWSIRAEAIMQNMQVVDIKAPMSRLSNQFPDIRKPVSLYRARDLDRMSVVVQTLDDDLNLEAKASGSVLEFEDQVQRVRYGTGATKNGDSGSPITSPDGELIGMHNARTISRSQAIPIGPILEDVRAKNQSLFAEILPGYPLA